MKIELTPERYAIIATLAVRFGLDPEDVVAWAIALLTRYVDAGGEP